MIDNKLIAIAIIYTFTVCTYYTILKRLGEIRKLVKSLEEIKKLPYTDLKMAKSEIEHLQDERQKLLGTIGELIKQIKEYEAEKSNTQT